MAKIFISYRREDAGFAVDQVHGALKPYAASADDIFVDVDNIPPGVDFVEHLNKYVDQCDVMLVAIGVNWLRAVDASGARRLDDREDFVRIEIETALARGIPVVPLLLGGAKMPGVEQLPESLKPLVRRQAVEIPRGGVQPAIDRMMHGLGFAEVRKTGSGVPGWLAPLAAVVVLAAGGFGLWQSGVLDLFLNPADQPVEVAAVETDDHAEMSDAKRDEANEREAARQTELSEMEALASADLYDAKALRAFLKAYPGSQNRSWVEARIAALETPGTTFTEVSDLLRQQGIDPAAVARAPGSTFRDTLVGGGKGPEMVVVPSGSFLMGSPSSEPGRHDDEGPQRTVTISKPFAVGRFEVTWAEWEACAADGDCDGTGPASKGGDNGWGKGNRPVIEVDWNDAKAYVRWLSRKTGEDYRLLSEAEWEYVARAGTTTAYSWGNDPNGGCAYSNGADMTAKREGSFRRTTSSCSDGYGKQTAPVGSFSANAFGLYDLNGNVWEWTEDCWNSSYSGAPNNGSAWLSGDCDDRVRRGGSWSFSPGWLRSAVRSWSSTSGRDSEVGFRIARDLGE